MFIQIYLASDITLSSQNDLINYFIDKFSMVDIKKNCSGHAMQVKWDETMSNVSNMLTLVF